MHPAAWLTAAAASLFAVVFGKLGVQHHRNFGTWSYDMGIYDQGFWLVSRGGQSFMTVRGMEFWGHHLNLIVCRLRPVLLARRRAVRSCTSPRPSGWPSARSRCT